MGGPRLSPVESGQADKEWREGHPTTFEGVGGERDGAGRDRPGRPRRPVEAPAAGVAAAGAALLDEWFDAIILMACDDKPPAETAIAAALPPAYRPRLTPALARRFHACLTTVLWKLAQPAWPRLACLAEELALHAVVRRAEADLGPATNFGAFEDVAFDDGTSNTCLTRAGTAWRIRRSVARWASARSGSTPASSSTPAAGMAPSIPTAWTARRARRRPGAASPRPPRRRRSASGTSGRSATTGRSTLSSDMALHVRGARRERRHRNVPRHQGRLDAIDKIPSDFGSDARFDLDYRAGRRQMIQIGSRGVGFRRHRVELPRFHCAARGVRT